MKTILLIAPKAFPPFFSSGSIRNTKILKFFNKKGWNCIALTDSVSYVRTNDVSLLDEVKQFATVFNIKNKFISLKSGINNVVEAGVHNNNGGFLFRLFFIIRTLKKALMSIIRYLLFVPDEYVLWNVSAFNFTKKLLRERKIQLILTSGPPFSAHLLGLRISRSFKIPWVADYRDQWFEHVVFGPKSFYRKTREQSLENSIVKEATWVTAATKSITDRFIRSFPQLTGKFLTIENGYDEDDLPHKDNLHCFSLKKECMNVVYTGSIGGNLSPNNLFKVIKKLLRDFPHLKGRIQFTFAGLLVPDCAPYFKDPDLIGTVHHIGMLPHKKALGLMKQADFLLLIIYPDEGGETIMCGKLYEYASAQKPLLGLVPQGEARDTITKFNMGLCCDPDDKQEIYQAILKMYKKWEKGELEDLPPPPQEFTREFQVNRLIKTIEPKVPK